MRKNQVLLLLSAIVTVALWQLPFGNYILYPFTILGTWFHEMGHGITAILTGGSFLKLEIFPNGSGMATHTSSGVIASSLTAAGGLLGPPIVGSAFILSGRNQTLSFFMLILLFLCLGLSFIWLHTVFGMLVIGGFMLVLAALFKWFPDGREFLIQFLGVQACVSTYRQLDYLFMGQANVGGQARLSDTGVIAANLLLPYWFWGGLIAALSFAMLALSLWMVCKPKPVVQSELVPA